MFTELLWHEEFKEKIRVRATLGQARSLARESDQ